MSLYDEMPARRILARTLRDHDHVPAIRSSQEIAEAIRRRLGARTTEEARRALDAECAKAARLFDALVDIGFGPVTR